MVLTRLIAFIVLTYGLAIVAGSLLRQIRSHGGHDIDTAVITLPLIIGLSYLYLASLLLRRKYNAWITATALSVLTLALNIWQLFRPLHSERMSTGILRVVLPVLILLLLVLSRPAFRVRSDVRSFREALQISIVLLLVAFLYGVGGFMLLDTHDFHREIGLPVAAHQTIDQFGLTTNTVVPHTKRARVFVDSLPVISLGAIAYAAISFFQPLRIRFASEAHHRQQTEALLRKFSTDIDDYFKLWPHDKHYFFDATQQAGLAYHVSRGVALVVGDLFGDPKSFKGLYQSFAELCFVNDWTPAFIHVSARNTKLYGRHGFRLQKIGEEAVIDLEAYQAIKNNKYFRQIRNKFTKLGYSVDILESPFDTATLARLRHISQQWLQKPGRSERGFMMGYHTDAYMQQGKVAVIRDNQAQIQGFINLVPTYEPHTANYDLLRCAEGTPGNCNDFLLMGLIEILHEQGISKLNLGLCPLAGLDTKAEDATLVDTALRFVYANGDRFYSFNGLRRFKAKYEPVWEDRYIAYAGGMRTFTRILTALNRAMRVK